MHTLLIFLFIAVSTAQDLNAPCDLLVTYQYSSHVDPINSTPGCNFPIQSYHNWSMLNLHLPLPRVDPGNPDWKDMFRSFAAHQQSPTACLWFQVGYTIRQDLGLFYLEINVECRGEPRTKAIQFEPMFRMFGEKDSMNVMYDDGRYNVNRTCLGFGVHKYSLQVGKTLEIVDNSTGGFITLGAEEVRDESSEFGDIACNCTDFKAYEDQLKRCISEPFKDLDLEEKRKNVTKVSKTVKSDGEFEKLVPLCLIGAGVLLVVVIYGSKFVGSGEK